MSEKRMYGFYRCSKCKKVWESAWVWCRRGTSNVLYDQDCKSCDTANKPYRVEPIKCSVCGQEDCICSDEEREKRKVDPNKPHLSELCHRCRAGRPCKSAF